MAVAEKNKQNAAGPRRGKAAKKEIEIPVVILGGKLGGNAPSAKSEDTAESDFKIVKDQDDLPIFENRGPKIEQSFLSAERSNEEKEAAGKAGGPKNIPADEFENGGEKKNHFSRTERKPAAAIGEKNGEKLGLLADPKRKETVMMVSVVLVASLIFFVWLVILRNNLSFSLGPQNPLSLSGEDQTLNNFRDSWDEISAQWSNFESALGQQRKAENVNQEVVNKLKEKILNEGTKEETGNAGVVTPK